MENKSAGVWVKASEKPKELLKPYYCRVRNKVGEIYREVVLITLTGTWQTVNEVIEWLDEGQAQLQQQINLFQKKEVTLHSGKKSKFFIECDALQDLDIEGLASVIVDKIKFGRVVGIPRGGIKLQEELEKYITPGNETLLICDDVLSSGDSMEEMREKLSEKNVKGVVLFSRGKCPDWVTPIFSLQSQQQEDRPTYAKDFKYFNDWWNTLKPQYKTPEIIFDHFKRYQSYFKQQEDEGYESREDYYRNLYFSLKKKVEQEEEHVNYGAMPNAESLYPVIYTVRQDGTKVLKPQYILGKELTEPQIKYLYDCGYFEENNIQQVEQQEESFAFTEWVGENYVKMHGGWMKRFSDQRDLKSLKSTQDIFHMFKMNKISEPIVEQQEDKISDAYKAGQSYGFDVGIKGGSNNYTLQQYLEKACLQNGSEDKIEKAIDKCTELFNHYNSLNTEDTNTRYFAGARDSMSTMKTFLQSL